MNHLLIICQYQNIFLDILNNTYYFHLYKMGRNKIKIEKIKNERIRQV
jgi:hypothetical protein